MQEIKKLGYTAKQLSGLKVKCDKCNGNLFTRVEILGESKFFPTICKCKKEANKRREQEEKRREIERKVDELIINGLMLKAHARNTFENDLYPNSNTSKTCRKYVENWTKVKKENIGLILSGEVGQGKTFYACCIANELVKRNKTVAITTIPRILSKLTKFTEEGDKLIQKLKGVELLVLDDFGTERKTDYANEQVFTLIDERLTIGLPTIITTNIDFNNWTTDNIAEQRVKDRILELCPVKLVVKTESESIRKLAAKKKAKNFIDYLK